MQPGQRGSPRVYNDQTRLGFCLPCPTGGSTAEVSDERDGCAVPFPDISNPNSAYMILPILTYWIPEGLNIGEQMVVASHEAVHLSLVNTSLSYYVNQLIHFQYAAIHQTLRYGGSTKCISVPSLRDPTGWIAQAQTALDVINRPYVLLQELMATTLVRFLAEKGLMFYTSWLFLNAARALFDLHPERMAPESNPYDKEFEKKYAKVANRQLFIPFPFDDVEVVEEFHDLSWLPYYQKVLFDPRPSHDFSRLHTRLLNAWRRLGENQQDDLYLKLLLMLVQFPFDIPWQFRPGAFWWPSLQACLNSTTEYISRMREEPVLRLNNMLDVIEAAKDVHDPFAWLDYLARELPGFIREEKYGAALLADFSRQMWQQLDAPHLAKLFNAMYGRVYDAAIVVRFNGGPVIGDHNKWGQPLRHLLLSEALRQSIVHGKSPSCMCQAQVRDLCDVKEYMRSLYESVAPDAGQEDVFERHWKRPTCV